LVAKTPTGRLIRGLKRKTSKPDAGASAAAITLHLQRYKEKKAIIEGVCRQFSIVPLLVWQPVPDFSYDMKYHLFMQPGSYKNQLQGYREMARLNANGQLGPNFLWCADL